MQCVGRNLTGSCYHWFLYKDSRAKLNIQGCEVNVRRANAFPKRNPLLDVHRKHLINRNSIGTDHMERTQACCTAATRFSFF